MTVVIGDGFGHWLAGFVDGEGSFKIQVRNNGKTHTPVFSLVLRGDDGAIIEKIRRLARAGVVYRYHYAVRPQDRYRRGPRVEWHVVGKRDVLKLVELFDRYPLRSKKQRDYATWRHAVLLWANRKGHRGSGSRQAHPVQAELARLKRELENGRRIKE